MVEEIDLSKIDERDGQCITTQKADEDTLMLTVLGDMIVLGNSARKG